MEPEQTIESLRAELEAARARIVELEEKIGGCATGGKCRALLLESPALAYQSLDEDGRVVDVNAAWLNLLGHERRDVLGRLFSDFLAEEHRAVFQENFVRLKASGATRNIEYDLVHKDGSLRHVFLDGCISSDERQRFQCTHCLLRDITGQKRIESELLSVDQQRRIILDSVPALIWAKDMKGRILMANKALLAAIGLEEDEVVGRTTHDIFPREIADAHVLVDRRILASGKPDLGVEEPFVTSTGEMGWCISDKMPLRDLQGKIVGTLGFSRDITNLKISQQAHIKSETIRSGLFENMSSGAVIYSVWGDGTRAADYVIIDYNAAGLRMENKPKEKVIGKSLEELYPGIDASPLVGRLHHVWSTGETAFVPAFLYRREQEPSGFWYEIRIFRLPSGEIVAIYDNVTARVEAEQALREREKLLRMVVENVRDGINVLDLKTRRYILMSPSQIALTGYTSEEFLNISANEGYARVHPEDRYIAINLHRLIAAGENDLGLVEYRWKVKSGEYRWFNDSRRLIRDEHGRPVALVGVSRDITDRKQMELELERTRQELRKLSEQLILAQEEERKRISQELHDGVLTDILALKVNLETARIALKRRGDVPDVPGLNAAVHSLAAIAEEVRRIVQGMRPMALDELGLKDALEGLTSFFQKRLPDVGVEFRFEKWATLTVPEAQSVVAFRLIQQALDNIASHAQGARRVGVIVLADADGLRVEVSDDGCGFDVGRLRFSPDHDGGLGLRGMRKRVEMVGGKLGIESAAGQGTTIRAWLPLSD
ncbi:PAS domain-containing sensor histidine kinase [Desulfonatronum lacustre]|uniref:PAS domain-containing sensor histidine kinase n=1 Tax=Desulfonatronum lacustre TaxID=66849 RepID=UPI00048B9630|nr:PAS domain S-box protein [Desulfonatronum lacustre]